MYDTRRRFVTRPEFAANISIIRPVTILKFQFNFEINFKINSYSLKNLTWTTDYNFSTFFEFSNLFGYSSATINANRTQIQRF